MNFEFIDLLFLILLLVVALLYSAVGHGGASGYIALMTIWGIEVATVRSTALVLNGFVSLIAFIQYYRQGHFKWSLTFPFLITSVPFAFLGAMIAIDSALYKKILGVILIISVIRLLVSFHQKEGPLREMNLWLAMLAGAAIGFLSGMIGIGGGIILSPLILLAGWAGIKNTSATSALFIFINSIAGLAGVWMKDQFSFSSQTVIWVGVAIAGALAGAYWGSRLAAVKQMRYILALVLAIASYKLVFA
ncbi:MAG TPA: sulfite exporter TauE/SafE family protein [Saprospiraceae bacterium]|nr:sulfite exporter TauE/SafE family protein [Saprospiraceae bacterium]